MAGDGADMATLAVELAKARRRLLELERDVVDAELVVRDLSAALDECLEEMLRSED